MTSPDPAVVQNCVDTAMSVLTPLVSDDDPTLSMAMYLQSDPDALLTGLMLACGWMLGVLHEAGVDQLACLQGFAAHYTKMLGGE